MPVVAKVAVFVALAALIVYVLSRPSVQRLLKRREPRNARPARPWVEYSSLIVLGLLGASITGTAVSWTDPRPFLEMAYGILLGVPFVVISVVGFYGTTLNKNEASFLMRAYSQSRVCRYSVVVAGCALWVFIFWLPLGVWLWEAL